MILVISIHPYISVVPLFATVDSGCHNTIRNIIKHLVWLTLKTEFPPTIINHFSVELYLVNM